jgi:hypothetical protein
MSDALPILKQAAWATIAQFVLSGKDEYGKHGIPRRPRSIADHSRSHGHPGTYTTAGCISVLKRKGVSRRWYWIIFGGSIWCYHD